MMIAQSLGSKRMLINQRTPTFCHSIKRICLLLVTLMTVAASFIAHAVDANAENQKGSAGQWRTNEGWELAKETDDIKVYTKEVKGSSLKAFRGVTQVKSSLSALVALLDDEKAASEWLHEVESIERIESLGKGHAINYSINTAPFPVSDRDMYFESKVKQDANTRTVVISLKGLPDYRPESDEYVRMKALDGEWVFKPQTNDFVEVVYQVHADPGGQLPSWLVNSIVVDTPLNSLKGLKQQVQKPKYQQAILSWLQEPKTSLIAK